MPVKPQNSLLLLITAIFLLIHPGVNGQISLLNRKISLTVKDKPVVWVLNEIERGQSLHFSYNSSILPEKSVTLNISNLPLIKVLEELLGKGYYFKSTSSHIIILKKLENERSSAATAEIIISGRVQDGNTGRSLASATLWNMERMESVLSDSNGRFTIRTRPRTSTLVLRCSKLGYRDSLAMIDINHHNELVFSILSDTPLPGRLQSLQSSGIQMRAVLPYPIVARLVGKQQILNSRNTIVYDHMPAQLSVIPNLSTNLKMSGAVTNNFSVNILGGYSAGVSGMETGGLVNITRYKVAGLQVCGGVNLGPDTLKGMQAAGFANYGSHYVNGVQFAGCFNYTDGIVKGAQFAGLFNYARNPGFQLAVINVADSCGGSPLGLVNIIRHGYYALVLISDEAGNISLLGNTGTHKLYNRFGISKYGSVSDKAWALSYGFGKHFRYGKMISWSTELFSSVIASDGKLDSLTISRVSFDLRINIRLSQHISLMAGPGLYTLIAWRDNPYISSHYSNNRDWYLSTYTPVNTRFENYWGICGGVSYTF